MKLVQRLKMDEVCACCGISEHVLFRYIEAEWIHPLDLKHKLFDEEDIARITLIQDLLNELEVNEEAIPIVLGLIDQINFLHLQIRSTQ